MHFSYPTSLTVKFLEVLDKEFNLFMYCILLYKMEEEGLGPNEMKSLVRSLSLSSSIESEELMSTATLMNQS